MPAMKMLRIGGRTLSIKDCPGFASARGLMFDSLKDKDGALIYANNIWMPFCRPLDLYFLDAKFRVLQKQKADPITLNRKTWRIYEDKKASYCLEIRQGMTNIRKGAKIILK